MYLCRVVIKNGQNMFSIGWDMLYPKTTYLVTSNKFLKKCEVFTKALLNGVSLRNRTGNAVEFYVFYKSK